MYAADVLMYPNPFNPVTKIRFTIPADEFVTLRIYNLIGEETALLVNNNLKAGYYEKEFNAGSFPSGIYYYKITTGSFSSTKKMILLKRSN